MKLSTRGFPFRQLGRCSGELSRMLSTEPGDTDEGSVESRVEKTTQSRQQSSTGVPPISPQTPNEPIEGSDPDSSYRFTHSKRGYAVLIMNHEFANEDENLPGVKHDIDSMSRLFTTMDFEVRQLINLTNEQLVSDLWNIQTEISSDCDCFVCVISTHGGEDPGFHANFSQEPGYTKTEHYVLNSEGALWTRHIMEMFNDQNCKALRGKPRLFFVQACRGNGVDKGVYLNENTNNIESNEDRSEDNSLNQDVFQIPCYNDSLVMFSSTSGKYAWSEDLEGGWLLSAINKVFSSGSGDDLLSLLTQVCGEVASREAFIPNNGRAHCSKSTACVYHKLCKDIYFPSSKIKYSDVDC